MRFWKHARPFLGVALLAMAGLFVGCGGSETVTIQFPEGAPIPPSSGTAAKQQTSAQSSQGDPSQYSR